MIAFKEDGVTYSIFATENEVIVAAWTTKKAVKVTGPTFKGTISAAKKAIKELAPTQ